jgi:hypothetical protein
MILMLLSALPTRSMLLCLSRGFLGFFEGMVLRALTGVATVAITCRLA